MKNIQVLKLFRDDSCIKKSAWGIRFPGQNAAGYGDKISLPYKVLTNVDNRRRRVFCCSWGNSGTTYIVLGGQRVKVDIDGMEAEKNDRVSNFRKNYFRYRLDLDIFYGKR